jgi:hypothetical protein
MPDLLALYLRNHEAAAQGGADLFRRAAANLRQRPYADEVRALRTEVVEDLRTLRGLMRRLQVRPDPVLGTAIRVGERIGRLKPNGHLLTRSPLSDLVEVEAMLDAVFAKANGWRALAAAGVGGSESELAELLERAEGQVRRLQELHREVSASVLG